jgi:hypothetical protein
MAFIKETGRSKVRKESRVSPGKPNLSRARTINGKIGDMPFTCTAYIS